MGKREDLQGIRGIAILSVLLFHFFPTWFPNGYIGVDQFFVLSGFLISLVLSKEEKISISTITDFYYRRVKRIFPLYLMFISCALVSLFFIFPLSNLDTNLESAWPALFYYTNVIAGTDVEKEYNAMLQVAEDVFTHTWSLSVEIQFYIFVPFIFYFLYKVKNNTRYLLLSILGIISFIYYETCPQMLAFNSVFARMWQFIIGIMCFHLSSSEKHIEKQPLLDVKEETSNRSTDRPLNKNYSRFPMVLTTVFMLVLVCQSLYIEPLPANVLRVSATLLTGFLILCGSFQQFSLLNFKLLTYLGDISYAAYLFHWPVVAYIKLTASNNVNMFRIGFLMSIVMSIIISETIEKYYLRLSRQAIIRLVLGLYIINILIICLPTWYEAQMTPTFGKDADTWAAYTPPKNLTRDQRDKWNYRMVSKDRPLLVTNKCDYVGNQKPWGWCEFKNVNPKGKYKILIIGNSHAPTGAELVYDYCKEKTYKMALRAQPSTDPLIPGSSFSKEFLEMVKNYKPDILFHITRFMKMMKPLKNGKPDRVLPKMIERIQELEKYVKKRIYIVHAVPRPKAHAGYAIYNLALSRKSMTDKSQISLLDRTVDWTLARKRVDETVRQCKKCTLIDYLPSFTHNDTYEVFDPISKFSYYSSGLHYTGPALEKLKPIYKNVCDNL